jgi:hypothetical protein
MSAMFCRLIAPTTLNLMAVTQRMGTRINTALRQTVMLEYKASLVRVNHSKTALNADHHIFSSFPDRRKKSV